jgi:hypothetical protein
VPDPPLPACLLASDEAHEEDQGADLDSGKSAPPTAAEPLSLGGGLARPTFTASLLEELRQKRENSLADIRTGLARFKPARSVRRRSMMETPRTGNTP